MIFECEHEYNFDDYREMIKISDGNVICCESGNRIPEHQPYALCQGQFEGEWNNFPQKLQIWRCLRNLNRSNKACFSFEGVSEQVEDSYSKEETLIKLQIQRAFKSTSTPRLHEWERQALESGLWFEWIQFPEHLRTFAADHPAGKLWKGEQK